MTGAYPADPRTGHEQEQEQGIGQLIGEITNDLSTLFRQEVDLAKAEMKQEAKKAGKASGMFAVAAVAGLMVIILLSFAVVYGLDAVMPQGWAAVIVAVLWAAVGAAGYFAGRKQLASVNPVPQQTVDTLKEDARWLRNPTG
jgi:protein-S-isoprenylcysteine O-methyltransferase Ste14